MSLFSIKAALSVVFVSIVFLTTAYSQDIHYISLEYSTAVRPDNAHVKIYISRDMGSTYSLRVESISLWLKINPVSLKPEVKPTEKKITITEGQFQAIVNSLQKIKQADITDGPHPSLLDGAICSISYGAYGATVRYSVNTPNYKTDKRNLNNFLHAYNLILRTAELDPEKIL